MADSDNLVVEGVLPTDVTLEDNYPSGAWVTREVSESVTDAMEKAPMGSVYEITYATMAARLRSLMTPNSEFDVGLIGDFVHSAINFRSLNPSFFSGGGHQPTTQPNNGAGSGDYHSALWGTNKDERLPYTRSQGTQGAPYSPGADRTPEQNKGLLVATLFSDLQHHLPTVLFNVVSKEYIPLGIGGSAVTRTFYRDGHSVSEIGYKVVLTVEATAVCQDNQAAGALQAIVEAAFGPLRDQFGTGNTITGKKFQLQMPTKVSPSPISEAEAPWAGGDDKGGKIYFSTVTLENVIFECFQYVSKPIKPNLSDGLDPISTSNPQILLANGDPGVDEPITLVLGKPQKLILSGATITSDLVVDNLGGRRAVRLNHPSQSGQYELVPRRVGEARLVLYDTGQVVPLDQETQSAGRVGAPLAERNVVVIAC